MTLISPQDFTRIQTVPLFKMLNLEQLEQVAQVARRRQIVEGEFLYQQEDPAETIYVLLRGRIRLSQVTPEGQQIILRYATPGDAIGIVAVLSEATYPVSAEAMEPGQVLSWDQGTMRRLMEQFPGVALNALRILSGRVREFQDRVRELSTERVERRIARALLRLARQTGKKVSEGVLIDMPISRQDLAEMTGTTLYTVSRTLSQWETKGLIKSRREQVVVCFPHGLVAIADDLPEGGSIPDLEAN